MDRHRTDFAGVSQGFLPRLPVGPHARPAHRVPLSPRTQGLSGDFSDFVGRVLASVPRTDQRRWGELYVRGLLTVPGRKTITRLAAPPADQSLQQFVNQSPWDWQTVRRDLAAEVERSLGVRAWVVQPVWFPKSGSRSVGVDRQYVPPQRRMVNCQAAVSAWLAGAEGGVPVDWNLVLPPRWVEDARLRSRAGIPADAVARKPWDCTVELIAGLAERLGLPSRPVVLDLRHGAPYRVLEALRSRAVPHVARVDPGTMVRLALPGARGLIGSGRPLSVAAAAAAVDSQPEPAPWQGPDQQRRVAKVAAVPVVLARRQHADGRPELPLLLLAERTRAGQQPHWFTLTDMADLAVPELVRLGKLGLRVDADSDRLVDERGLTDFEGRSWRGWQHHVTLVSIAHAYETIRSATRRGRVH
jgi:hypothetical protein